jgi:hypothetical protein
MKKRILYIAFLLWVISLCSVQCTKKRDLSWARKMATKEYENVLHESRINPLLFKGPSLNLENPKFFIFEWRSRVPREGALLISIYVPIDGGEISNSETGDERDWNYVHDTRDKPINEAILGQLFDLSITPNDTSERTKRLGKLNLTVDQMADIVNFIEIKRKLIEYYFRIGGYPNSLSDLNLEWRLTRDANGNKYSYQSNGRYAILGTPGANGKWEIDSVPVDSIFKDEKEFFQQSGDDLLVKFMPVVR